jgi:hypothetical protein
MGGEKPLHRAEGPIVISSFDSMVRDGLLLLFERIADQLYRFPAVNPQSLRNSVEQLAARG